jgi:hypothetical protein
LEIKNLKGIFHAQMMKFHNHLEGKPLSLNSCSKLGPGINPILITWNTLIVGYASYGHANESLKHFYQMQIIGMNLITLRSAFAACSSLVALQQGKEIHRYIIRSGFESDIFVGSALINMYAKCGIQEVACQLFDKTHIRYVIAWMQ